MNIFLWVLQILLAIHTLMGSTWKFFNSERTVPSLSAIPHGLWLALSAIELLCTIGLILPAFNKRLGILAPIAAAFIVAEMLLFCALHLFSGDPNDGEIIYWLVVAAISAFIAWGRFARMPVNTSGSSALERPVTPP